MREDACEHHLGRTGRLRRLEAAPPQSRQPDVEWPSFPTMDPARWQQIERLYHQALAHPAQQRIAFLAEACRDDEPLRREVQALLDAQASAVGFRRHQP